MPRHVLSLRSQEVREIAAHLTAFERGALVASSRDYGRRLAWRLSLPLLLSILLGFYSLWLAGVVLAVAALLLLPSMMRAQCDRTRALLCASEWARGRGIRSDSLRLFSFPSMR